MSSNQNKRIRDLANELGLDGREVIRLTKAAGINVPDSVHASLSPVEQQRLAAHIQTQRTSQSRKGRPSNPRTQQPSDAPLTQDEIRSLAHDCQVALAVRCALRIAPIAGALIDVWHDESVVEHVQAIDAAAWLALSHCVRNEGPATRHSTAVASACVTATLYAANVAGLQAVERAGAAAFAAADAVNAAIEAPTNGASWTIDAVARAAEVAGVMARIAARRDFAELNEMTYFGWPVEKSFFNRRLWEGTEPSDDWMGVVTDWAEGLPTSSERIGERYFQMLKGRIDWEGGFADLDRWIAENVDPDEGDALVDGAGKPERTSAPEVVELQAAASTASRVTADLEIVPIPRPLGVASSMGDSPADRDLLGRGPLVRALAAIFRSPRQATPFTVGLLGDWGSGKSSVLTLLEQELQRPHETAFDVAWFDAWQYEKTDNIAAGLAQEVTRSLLRGPTQSFRYCQLIIREAGTLLWGFLAVIAVLAWVAWQSDVRDAIAEGLKIGSGGTDGSVVLAVLIALLAIGFLLTQMESVWKSSITRWFGGILQLLDYRSEIGKIPSLQRHLKTLAKLRLGELNGICSQCDLVTSWVRWYPRQIWSFEGVPIPVRRQRRRLLVFVDNLDRCQTECIVDVLDAVRLVMDLEHVVVVVAVDHKIALQAVAKHYEKLATPGRSPDEIARDYLAKIVQLPIRLRDAPDLNGFISEKLFGDAIERPQHEWEQPRYHTEISVANSASLRDNEPAWIREAPAQVPEVATSPRPVRPSDIDQGSGDEHANEVSAGLGQGSAESTDDSEPVATSVAVADADTLEAEMQDDTNEQAEFLRLSEFFEIDNPRRLVRLRNSYRVLKLVNRIEAGENGEPPYRRPDLMRQLFWQEFISRLTRKDRATVAQMGIDPLAINDWQRVPLEDEPTCRTILGKLRRDSTLIDKIIATSIDDRLDGFVRSLILPFSETMVGTGQDRDVSTESK